MRSGIGHLLHVLAAGYQRLSTSLPKRTTRAKMRDVKRVNVANGWYDRPRSFGDDVALLHSEVSELLEAYREGDADGMHLEAADVLIRLLDTCERYGIDLDKAYMHKMRVNRARPYRHGGKAL